MKPPAHAVVLSIDKKSQIQALERTRLDQPLGSGHPAAQTHDYTRHGTTTLFAALNVLDGTVLGRCMIQGGQSYLGDQFLNTWLLLLGGFFILVVRFLPRGLAGLLEKVLGMMAGRQRRDPDPIAPPRIVGAPAK